MKEPEHQERTWKSRGKVFGERAEALRLFQLRENSEYDMIETQSKKQPQQSGWVQRKAVFMFGRKTIKKKTYDRENLRPVLRCSICTGEQVAGFKNIHTGKFEEVMLIRGQKDLDLFKEMYEVETVAKEY